MKYQSLIKKLVIVPVLVGLLSISDSFLPIKEIDSKVISKDIIYSNTEDDYEDATFTIEFEHTDAIVEEEVYDFVESKETYTLSISPLYQTVKKVSKNKDYILTHNRGEMSTILGIVFLLSSIIWFVKRELSIKEGLISIALILASLIMGLGMLASL